MQTEEKNNETGRGRSERRNCLRKCFLLSKLFTLLRVIPSVLLAASSQIASQLLQAYNTEFFYLNTI